jgi:hypothetical protein
VDCCTAATLALPLSSLHSQQLLTTPLAYHRQVATKSSIVCYVWLFEHTSLELELAKLPTQGVSSCSSPWGTMNTILTAEAPPHADTCNIMQHVLQALHHSSVLCVALSRCCAACCISACWCCMLLAEPDSFRSTGAKQLNAQIRHFDIKASKVCGVSLTCSRCLRGTLQQVTPLRAGPGSLGLYRSLRTCMRPLDTFGIRASLLHSVHRLCIAVPIFVRVGNGQKTK